ncbi:MAG: hypothetical protein WBW84_13940 [Acidobacteriaceae bacterium]
MTPDQKIVLWAAAISAVPTALFTGWVAWWTWRRDQERIVVQKSPMHWETMDGSQTDATLCGFGIVVTNLSLFPVRIIGLGIRLNRKHAFAFDRTEHRDAEWPAEIASHARIVVYASEKEWTQIKAKGLDKRIMNWIFVAVARTETGGLFASNRLNIKLLRPFRSAGRRLRYRK